MIKIAFFNQKGGVGKTTSVVNLAATFAKRLKKSVLVVDCDSQKTSTNYLLTYTDYQYSIEDYFDSDYYDKRSISSIITNAKIKTSLNREEYEQSKIDVLPSYSGIETLPIEDIYAYKNLLEPVESKYDYCFFDLPPHLSGVSLSALVSCNWVIVPANADTDSLSGYNDLIDTITEIRNKGYNLKLNVLGVLFNDINTQRMIQKHILKSSYKDMADSLFKVYIKSASAIEQGRYMGIPLPYVSLNRKINDDYEKLAKEIVKRIKEMENRNA